VAPWSYQELIGAIGLEGAYQLHLPHMLKQGIALLGREKWAKAPAPCWLQPAQFILALQAGVQFSVVVQSRERPAPKLWGGN
jgi:hypothetical protein